MNLKTTKCACGHEFTRHDIKPPLNRVPRGFYGGNVTRTSAVECECGRKYQLWLKPIPNSWRVVTIAADGWKPDEEEQVPPPKIDPDKPLDDEFDAMNKDALKAWLDERNVEYIPQWGEKRLRETARAWLAAQQTNTEDTDE